MVKPKSDILMVTKREFTYTKQALRIMREGKILSDTEDPEDMIERVAAFLYQIDKDYFSADGQSKHFFEQFRDALYSKKVVPSTPIMTNAGRFLNKPLSACCVPPISLGHDLTKIKKIVDIYHEDGMGCGFNLDEAEDPIMMLLFLNDIAVKGLQTKEQRRPVGNMGVLSINSPHILDFIQIKKKRKDIDWKFNLSVNVTEEFMGAVLARKKFMLRDGLFVDANKMLDLIAECACDCGDPGLVFMDTLQQRSHFRKTIRYVSVAPCGEIGLGKGETCQFLYLNLHAFCNGNTVDFERLRQVIPIAVRALDNALEHSVQHYYSPISKNIMLYTRKIGLGVCGFSNMLIHLGIVYGSEESKILLERILSFINFESKKASIVLAQTRGACLGFIESEFFLEKNFLTSKFGKNSDYIPSHQWRELDNEILQKGIRNSTTVVLPPTGRSSLVFDTSQQIEPIFSLYDGELLNGILINHLSKNYSPEEIADVLREIESKGSIQHIPYLDTATKRLFRTSIEIPFEEHFKILCTAQEYTDEAVSKTINLPETTTPKQVKEIYLDAYKKGLCGITVYREGSSKKQPVRLK